MFDYYMQIDHGKILFAWFCVLVAMPTTKAFYLKPHKRIIFSFLLTLVRLYANKITSKVTGKVRMET